MFVLVIARIGRALAEAVAFALREHAPVVAVIAHFSLIVSGHGAEAATGHLHLSASTLSPLFVDLGLFVYGVTEAIRYELERRHHA